MINYSKIYKKHNISANKKSKETKVINKSSKKAVNHWYLCNKYKTMSMKLIIIRINKFNWV